MTSPYPSRLLPDPADRSILPSDGERGPIIVAGRVADCDEVELLVPPRRPHGGGVARPPAQERARQRRHERDPARARVSLVHTHDLIEALSPALTAQAHHRAETDLVTWAIGRRHDHGAGQPLVQV